LKRHRLEDGIPKEEEEKPRKRIVQQAMVQRNRYFSEDTPNPAVFSSIFMMISIT